MQLQEAKCSLALLEMEGEEGDGIIAKGE